MPKIYYDRDHAISERFYLNQVSGFAPAYIYRVDSCGAWIVLRTWDVQPTALFRSLSLTLED